ncbi:MAG TPA: hypothetical protein VFC93_03355 [Chloroflexota bacterium]|nr:hypothetical protein [Chloroflexota bacterium]
MQGCVRHVGRDERLGGRRERARGVDRLDAQVPRPAVQAREDVDARRPGQRVWIDAHPFHALARTHEQLNRLPGPADPRVPPPALLPVRELAQVLRVLDTQRQLTRAVGDRDLERRVAALVAADVAPIRVDGGLVVDRAEPHEDVAAPPLVGHLDQAPVPDDAGVVA